MDAAPHGNLHLIYHEASEKPSSYTYCIGVQALREHLQLLMRINAEMEPGFYSGRITFDDGHRSQYMQALPLLAEHNLSAMFFITAGWTGENPDYMDAGQVREITAMGHRVGAHGLSHKLLTQCSELELNAELSGSKKRLEDILGRLVSTMSLPEGRYNRRVLEACAAVGYAEVYTSEPTTEVRDVSGIKLVGRYNVRQSLSARQLEQLLDSSSGALKHEQRKSIAKKLAQRVLGDRAYKRLWSAFAHER